MKTIAGLADRLEMTAEEAVDVLRKLNYDIKDVNSTIDQEMIDLLLDADENPDLLNVKMEAARRAREVAEKKLKEAEEKAAKKVAKVKAKAAPKPKAAAKPKAEPKKKAAAKPKDAPPKTALRKKAKAAVEAPEMAEDEIVETTALPGEAALAVPVEEAPKETEADHAARGKGKPVPPAKRKAVAKILVDVSQPEAEIITGEYLAEVGDKTETGEGQAVGMPEEHLGVLAEAERRHEQAERRKAEREKEKTIKPQSEKTLPLSAITPDPDVVAAVIRRDEEKKRRVEEEKQRRLRGSQEVQKKGKLTTSLPAIALGTEANFREAPSARKGGQTKTAKKKQKRAERMRIRETSLRQEAEAAVREYQSGVTVPGTRKKRRKHKDDFGAESEHEFERGGVIEMEEMITVEQLAALMEIPVNNLILEFMDDNIMVTKNQTLELDVARRAAEKHGYELQIVIPEEEDLFREELDAPEDLSPRPPVVTVMGHVDHGKTSLLDAIRSTNVAQGEAGGITQHIAAYDIELETGRVTFLDTPGHEAFTQMRARGARVTDVVVLVVAANDGVRPQTVEAINHAKAAEVPIVIAINKCDLANAEPDRVRQELTQYGLLDEKWGGKTVIKNISAKTKEGVQDLLELLALQAELLELKANPGKKCRGTVIEAEKTVGMGSVAWVLVQSGTLRVGDAFLAGNSFGRVRTVTNCRGKSVESAGPSTPVVVTGFSVPPAAGDVFFVTADEKTAREIAEKRSTRARAKKGPAAKHMTLEDFHARFMDKEQKSLNMIVKADVQGSVDVLQSSFAKLGNEEVHINVIHAGVGGINESDVLLAEASDAVIIGFHVVASAKVKKMAEHNGVEIRVYRIIYEALDDVRGALEGLLTPESREIIVGHAEVRQVFRSSTSGNIAGSYQTDGETQRGTAARLVRDGVVVYTGRIESLRRQRDDVRAVQAGFECGIKLERFNDIQVGDVIETYKVESVAKTLNQAAS